MASFYNPQHQGWEMAKFASLMRVQIQRNMYPVGSTAWEDYERGVQFYRDSRTWEGKGGKTSLYHVAPVYEY